MLVRNRLSIVASVAAMMLAACSDSTTPAGSSGAPGKSDSGTTPTTPTSDSGTTSDTKVDIVQTAAGAGTFKILGELLTAADLVNTLKGAGPFTVLAPTDAAFAKLPAALVTALKDPANKALLTQILTYHVIGASVLEADVVKLTKAASFEGENLNITVADGKVVINKSTTSPAFVNNANVTATNIQATNGVIHVIDTVLASDIALLNLPAAQGKDLVDTAVASASAAVNPEFKTLVAAVQSEGLVSTLKGPGPFTVFAPTDAAFQQLGITTRTIPAPPALGPTLLYHAVPGIIGSAAVVALNGKDVVTAGKKTFKIKVIGTDVFLTDGSSNPANDVKVIKTDIATKNGLIHVIDTVLTPPKL